MGGEKTRGSVHFSTVLDATEAEVVYPGYRYIAHPRKSGREPMRNAPTAASYDLASFVEVH